NSAVATVTITVNPINDAPVAEAGPDQTVFVDDVVSLDGTNSSDPEADTLTYAWTQTGGSTVILSDANAVQSTFTALLGSETLEFEVEVSDGALSSTDRVVVTVNEIVNDAFVSQEPTVTNGLVVGSIDATMFSYGQVQTLTEARSGRKGC
ncbi:MAG: Ig-like domain-containing protein, partial [Verrucomicrobiales bacterium]|nr:Ig-like domain-containing protein [Verrucomicrobiales bacterium]